MPLPPPGKSTPKGEAVARTGVASGRPRPPVSQRNILSGQTLYFVVSVALAAGLIAAVFLANANPHYNITGPPRTCSPSNGDVIGSCFAMGAPYHRTCPADASFATVGCSAGDSLYTLTIEQSTLTFGQVALKVISPAGTVFSETGSSPGFSVLSLTGTVEAFWIATTGGVNMSSDWSYGPGGSDSSPLTTTMSIDVDVGTANLTGQGYSVLAFSPQGEWYSTADTLP
jgi:hypothetical protein